MEGGGFALRAAHSPLSRALLSTTLTLSCCPQLEGKRRAKEREAQADAAAEARARAEAEGSVGRARFAARAPPSPRSVREALDAQVLERERLAGEERAWQGAADAAMLGYSAAAQQIG